MGSTTISLLAGSRKPTICLVRSEAAWPRSFESFVWSGWLGSFNKSVRLIVSVDPLVWFVESVFWFVEQLLLYGDMAPSCLALSWLILRSGRLQRLSFGKQVNRIIRKVTTSCTFMTILCAFDWSKNNDFGLQIDQLDMSVTGRQLCQEDD